MKLNLQYSAGLFDGEGTIGIIPLVQRKHSLRWSYQARVTLVIRERFIVEAFEETFGGRVALDRPSTEKHSSYWRWFASGVIASDFCKIISQYMHLKRKQAEILIEFQEAKLAKVKESSYTKLSDSEYENYTRLYRLMRETNQKGVGK